MLLQNTGLKTAPGVTMKKGSWGDMENWKSAPNVSVIQDWGLRVFTEKHTFLQSSSTLEPVQYLLRGSFLQSLGEPLKVCRLHGLVASQRHWSRVDAGQPR